MVAGADCRQRAADFRVSDLRAGGAHYSGMKIRTLLRMTGIIGATGLALVALPRKSEPSSELPPRTTAAATDPAATPTRPSTPAPRHLAVPSVPVQTGDQPLSPDEPEGAVALDGDNLYYHDTVELQTEPIVPCANGVRPDDLEDPQCIARWTVFHVAGGLVELLDAQWIKPTLLDELSTTKPSAKDQLPSELLVLDSIGPSDQVGPGRAEVEVIVERAWASGQFDHLFYRVTLLRNSNGSWIVVTIERI